MRFTLLLLVAVGMLTQQPASSQSPDAGNDITGYTDTPQLPGQPWKVRFRNIWIRRLTPSRRQ